MSYRQQWDGLGVWVSDGEVLFLMDINSSFSAVVDVVVDDVVDDVNAVVVVDVATSRMIIIERKYFQWTSTICI